MTNSEQLYSLFSHTENELDYEEEKRKKKQKLVRNEFEKSGKYGMSLIKKQKKKWQGTSKQSILITAKNLSKRLG